MKSDLSIIVLGAACAVAACDSSSSGGADAAPDANDAVDAGTPDAGNAGPERLLQGGAGIHVVPHVAARADGTTWLSWYAAEGDGGSYSIRLQRMDTSGARQLGPDGVLASAADSESFVMDHALVAAGNGDAVVAYSATSDYVARVQRFDAAGAPVWGPSGTALTTAPENAYAPHVVACADGSFVVAWDFESGEASGVALQRVDASGHAVWAEPVRIEGPEGVDAQSPRLVAGEGGDVFVVWRQSPFNTPGDAFAQRFDADGQAVWATSVQLNDGGLLPFPHIPLLVGDGQGGFYAAWSTIDGNLFAGSVQQVDQDGGTTWPAGGLRVSNDTSRSHLPSAIDAASGRVVVAWTETDELQDLSGLYVQAFDTAGQGAFAPAGLPIVEATTAARGLAAGVRADDGGVALFYAFAPPSTQDVRAGVAAVAFDAPTPALTTLSDVPSAKSDPDVSARVGGGHWLVWTDGRSGRDEIWGAWWQAP